MKNLIAFLIFIIVGTHADVDIEDDDDDFPLFRTPHIHVGQNEVGRTFERSDTHRSPSFPSLRSTIHFPYPYASFPQRRVPFPVTPVVYAVPQFHHQQTHPVDTRRHETRHTDATRNSDDDDRGDDVVTEARRRAEIPTLITEGRTRSEIPAVQPPNFQQPMLYPFPIYRIDDDDYDDFNVVVSDARSRPNIPTTESRSRSNIPTFSTATRSRSNTQTFSQRSDHQPILYAFPTNVDVNDDDDDDEDDDYNVLITAGTRSRSAVQTETTNQQLQPVFYRVPAYPVVVHEAPVVYNSPTNSRARQYRSRALGIDEDVTNTIHSQPAVVYHAPVVYNNPQLAHQPVEHYPPVLLKARSAADAGSQLPATEYQALPQVVEISDESESEGEDDEVSYFRGEGEDVDEVFEDKK